MNISFFYIFTLGCKVNQYESQSIREAWVAKGWSEAKEPSYADVVLINSCAITAKAVADVRSSIRKFHRESPKAKIYVTGCAAETFAHEFISLPGVEKIIEQNQKSTLFELPSYNKLENYDLIKKKISANRKQTSTFPSFSITNYKRSRPVVKIQDGCSHRCTYCIVPLTRGSAVSRPLGDSLSEIQKLLDAGFREIIISGINLRQYTLPSSNKDAFWVFIEALEERFSQQWQGKARFRISSLEPVQLSEKGIKILSASTLISPHLHLSLQSGSNSVLKRMGRSHYDPLEIFENLKKLSWPIFALGADLISGFPGETPEEHQETVDLCQSLPLSYAHIFPFSSRPGTVAANLKNHIPKPTIKKRAASLRTIAEKKMSKFMEKLVQLPEVTIAPEHSSLDENKFSYATLQGLNQFYVECLCSHHENKSFPSQELFRAKPIKIENNRLLVIPF